MVANDVIAMRAVDGGRMPRTAVWPDGHWDWTVHLPYRHGLRVGDLVFTGGQVPLAPDASVLAGGDMIEQTKISMAYIGKIVGELGLGFQHVVKVNSFYKGDVGPAILAPNAETRFRHFPAHGPTSTGVPVPWLAYEGMLTEIDIVAMV
jgi:enamine deaminase RidA (YjgF/YER057c/UK114 family)